MAGIEWRWFADCDHPEGSKSWRCFKLADGRYMWPDCSVICQKCDMCFGCARKGCDNDDGSCEHEVHREAIVGDWTYTGDSLSDEEGWKAFDRREFDCAGCNQEARDRLDERKREHEVRMAEIKAFGLLLDKIEAEDY